MTALAIVGMACRFPDADSPDELWENVLAQRRAFRRLPAERLRGDDYFSPDPEAPDRTYAMQAAVLDGWKFDRVRFRISGRTFRAADLAHWLALDVAAEALAAAGYPDGAGLDRERTAVIVGNTLTGEFSRARSLRLRWPYVRRVVGAALERERMPEGERERLLAELERDFKQPFGEIDEETLAGGLSNTIAGRICNFFDLKGGAYTVDGACASSLLAVATAATALERGDVDVAIAGGVDLSLDPFELIGFAKAGALAREEMRVYDRRSQGFWPGEGCGFVVLRRLADVRSPAPVAVRGWGISSDGTGGITRPELPGQLLALRRAYARTDFDIGSVDLFEGHGTGTVVGDATELAALTHARAEARAPRRAAIGSIKANIGHTKAAAGVAGLIKAAMSLTAEVIPPATSCGEPHDELRSDGANLRVAAEPEPWPADGPRRAAVSAMGFGGVNTHVVLERVGPSLRLRRLGAPERRLGASAQDAELFLFAGTRREVAASVAALARAAPELSIAELGDAAAALHAELTRERGGVRAAVVASRADELARGLELLGDALDAGEASRLDTHSGVFLGSGARPARVAYLFSGQGTAVTADGGALARRFGVVRSALAEARLEPAADTVDTAFAQPAIVASSIAGLALLDRLGVEADVAVGHSLGELTALYWAGALDAAGVVRLADARGRAMRALGRRAGAMAGLVADAASAARLCVGTQAVVAGVNAPDQTVVSGTVDAVAEVVRRAAAEGISATQLPVSHAFHSQVVAPSVEALEGALREAAFSPLRRPVVSTVTGEALDPEADLRALLVRQVTAPVLFMQALELTAARAELLVEVGPGRVLASLAARQAAAAPSVALEVGAPTLRPALLAAAALFAAGAVRDTDPLFEGRFTRPFELGAVRRFLANPCEAAPLDVAPDPARNGTPAADGAPTPAGDLLAVVRELVAAQAELPVAAVADDSRLLGDLHLSSIAVGEIAARAARALGCAPPAAPSELATATVAELASALERLAETAPEDEPAVAAGVEAWIRPFERIFVERPSPPTRTRVATRWTVVSAKSELADAVAAAFAGEGDGDEQGVVLALDGERDETVLRLLVEAARRDADRFAVVERGEVAGAFARVVHLERAVPTAVVGVERDEDLQRARAEAESTVGFAEVRFDRSGARRVPLLRPLELAEGSWPLAPGDLALVTGGGKGIVAECALDLARRHGLSLVLVGRSDPDADPELAANLRRFGAAGVEFRYESVDVCDGEELRRVLGELGPVRAVLHGAGVNEPALLADVDADSLARTIAPKVHGLRNVLDAVDVAELRLLAGFGSIIGTMGLRGEAHYALANEWLRLEIERVAARASQCRCVHVAWSVWAGAGMGERLGTLDALARVGVDPIAIDDGIALLDDLLCADRLPVEVVAAGRFGLPPTVELERAERPLLRFVERTALDYPGVELVAEAELGDGSDPYLADHVLDGVRLLPAVLGMEAMAQASSAVLGRSPNVLENVTFEHAVTVPPADARKIRTAALRGRDGSATAVVRSDESGFRSDHFRATFRTEDVSAETVDGAASEGEVPLRPEELYGGLLFHGPRFRRLRRYRVLSARRCVAEVDGRGDAWFGPFLPPRLLLGDPGVHDAVLHVLQACVPGERVLPVGIERLAILQPPDGEGPFVVSGREREADGKVLVWDVDVAAPDGALVERWQGLRLQRVGATTAPERWPVPLLVPYLERRVAELTGRDLDLVLARRAARASSDRAVAAAAGTNGPVERRYDGRPEVGGRAVSAAHVDGFTLAVAGEGTVACDVERVVDRAETMWQDLLGRSRFDLAAGIAGDLDEGLDTTATRLWAASECVQKAGTAPAAPLTVATCSSDGWVLLRSGGAPIATYAGRVAGADRPLAFAFLARGGG